MNFRKFLIKYLEEVAKYYERINVTGIALSDMYPYVSGEFTPVEIYSKR